MSAPQYCSRANISHNNQKFGHSLRPRGGHGGRKFLMDSHPYSHETSIFTLGAPHEEVQGRQTKLHPGFTMGKLVQPSPGISIQFFEMPTLFCPTGLNDVLQNFLIGQWTSIFIFAFFYKNIKMAPA